MNFDILFSNGDSILTNGTYEEAYEIAQVEAKCNKCSFEIYWHFDGKSNRKNFDGDKNRANK